MKKILILFFLCFSISSFAQLRKDQLNAINARDIKAFGSYSSLRLGKLIDSLILSLNSQRRAAGYLPVGNTSGIAVDVPLSGDGTLSSAGSLSVTKILGNTIPSNASGVLTNNGSGTLSWGAAVSTFQSLTDGPGSFSGKTLNLVRVNAGETALEYRTTSQVLSDIGGESVLTFSNGLTRTANNIKLGGTITDATTLITGGNVSFEFNFTNGTNQSTSDFSPSNISLYQSSNSGVKRGTITLSGGDVSIQSTGASSNTSELAISQNGGSYFRDTGVSASGLRYYADYSSGYTARSLIDKGFATATYAPISITGTITSIATTSPITGGTITTTGTIACATCVTSAASLTSNALVIGGGSQATSTITTGTNVLTALGVNVGSSGAFVVNGGALGTPSSGIATNLTGTASGLIAGTVTTNANLTGDVTSSGNATTLAIVNSNVGTFGSATTSLTTTVNAKGLITAISSQTVTPALGSITGLGTNWPTALGASLGSGWTAALNAAYSSGSGTVTSVAMTVPSFLSVSGSPITGAGTLGVTLSGTALPAINGGTGLTSYTTGNLPYASASNTLSNLAIGTTGQVLTVSGGIPSWAAQGASNNKQPWVGYIFQESAWTSLGSYTTNTPASTISISGGVLTLTGGANNFANYIKRNYTTAATTYFIDANIKPTADGNGIGLGILVSGTNTLTMEMDCNTAGARGTVYITLNGTRIATSTTVMSYTNSTDVLNFSLHRNNNNWIGTVYNTITGTTVSVTFGQDFTVANGVALKMGQPFIYIKGGTFTVTGSNSFNYFIQQKKGAPVFCGDSETEGVYAVAQNTSYVDILRQLCSDPIELLAAGGTTSADWANTLATELVSFAPSVVYIMIGTNDATASTSQATYAANLTTFETALTGYKIVYLYVPPHGSSSTIEGFIAQYNTTLSGKTHHIDIHTPLYNATTALCASSYIASDNLHLNAAGNAIVAKTIQQSTTATTDLPFNSYDKQFSLMTRGGSTFSLDRIASLNAGDKLYLTGGVRGINFNSTTDNAVIQNNFAGNFTMAAGTNYSMMVWPTMTAIANAQVVYGVSSRDNRSLGAFTDGGWYGLVAQSSGGTDIARIGLTSTGTQVLELNANTLLNTTGTASASGSVANLTYASSGGKNFVIRNTTAGGAMAYVLGNDAAALGAYMQLNGSTASGNSGANALNFVNPTNSTGKMGWWKSGATPMMELTNTFGGSLSIGASLATYNLSVTQAAQASGVPKIFTLIGAAHTATTASTENTEVLFDFSATIGINTGAMGTNRMMRILPRTYNYVGATTASKVVTLSLDGGPVANTNATHTLGIAFEIGSNAVGSGTVTSYAAFFNALTGATTNIGLGFAAGTTTTAPLRFLTGTSMTTPIAGVVEYTTDDLFFTISTGTARKRFLFADATAGLTSGKVIVATTNGRLKDGAASDFASAGVASVVSSTFEKAETGTDANVLTYTTNASTDEYLLVGVSTDISALTGTSVTVTVTWKDSNNTTATSSVVLSGVGDGSINVPINAFKNTSVVVSTSFIGASTAYNISSFVTRLK